MIKNLTQLFGAIGNFWVRKQQVKHLEALLHSEKAALGRKTGKINAALIEQGALCEKLLIQEKESKDKIAELTNKIQCCLNGGDEELAGQYAIELEYAEKDHNNTLDQIRSIQKTYEESVAARNNATLAINARIQELTIKIREVNMRKATQSLQSAATGIITDITNDEENSFKKLEELVNDEYAKSKSLDNLNKISGAPELIGQKEAKYLGAGALARFKEKKNVKMLA